jgi:hypothetical protein
MNDEIAFVEGATAAHVAAVPSKNQVERLLADGVPCVQGRSPRSAVDDYESGVD